MQRVVWLQAGCFVLLSWGIAAAIVAANAHAEEVPGPLRTVPGGRYFVDSDGRAVFLAGFHDGWELQDFAWDDWEEPVRFDWNRFLDELSAGGISAIRLWCVEHTKLDESDPQLTTPMPFLRVPGHGKANDGGEKFDLDRLNAAYFRRLEQRVAQAAERGIYVVVMLFQGWSIEDKEGRVNPWPYHPFHRSNNVNGVDGDLNGDGQGREVHTWLGADHSITRYQRAYVRKVVETVGRFDNVLYEVANESHADSLLWQEHMVEFIRQVEGRLGKRHPVGISVPFSPRRTAGLNARLFRCNADWVSPNREAARGFDFRTNPPPADGRKVVLLDTDHLFGVDCRDPGWVWRAFCRGYNVLYMDRWSLEHAGRRRQAVRRNLGIACRVARQIPLEHAVPHGSLASSGYCLVVPGRHYLVLASEGRKITLDLAEAEGSFEPRWIVVQTGKVIRRPLVQGGCQLEFTSPVNGQVVLWLSRASGDRRN